MIERVYVFAYSARTPLGLTAATSAAAAMAGVSRITVQPGILDRRGRPVLTVRDSRIAPAEPAPRRMAILAASALKMLSEQICAVGGQKQAIPLLLAIPEPRPGFADDEATDVVRHLENSARGAAPQFDVRVAGRGRAGALRALAEGHALVATGRTGLCLIGGVDSHIDRAALGWLDERGRLAGEGRRGASFPGEAAGLLAIGTTRAARSLGLPVAAEILGTGSATEPRPLAGEQELLGEGLTAAIRAALASGSGPVDVVYGDLDGERARNEEWGFAQLRIPGMLGRAAPCRTFAGNWGDCGAAVGALHCIQAVHEWQRGHAKGNRALIWGASEEGSAPR